MKTTIKLGAAILIGGLLGACASSNNVVSGHLITKRKVNKGFHINRSGKLKSSSDEALEIERPEFIQYEELANSAVEQEKEIKPYVVLEKELINTSSEQTFKEEQAIFDAPVEEEQERVASPVNEAPHVVIEKKETQYHPNQEIRNSKKNHLLTSRGEDPLLCLIVALFIPFVGVWLFEGKWTRRCTINLILTLLFYLPGLIHAFIVILGD